MEYLDNLITRLASKCVGVSPGGGTISGSITVDMDTITIDSETISVDSE